jgi:hypothetical protein
MAGVIVRAFAHWACSYVRALNFLGAFDQRNDSRKLVQQVMLIRGAPTVLYINLDFPREPFAPVDERPFGVRERRSHVAT